MFENFPYRVRNRPLALLNHDFVHRPKLLVQSLKTCECISVIKDRLFSKHTVQSDSSKTIEICVFRQIPPYGSSATTHDGIRYLYCYSGTAKCNNNNVEVQTFDAIDLFQPKNGTSHSLRFPAHTIQHNCMKYLLKYPSPVKTRNPDELKFVQPSSSKKMWSTYVGLHNVFEFHLKTRCTVEFQAPFFLGKV